jgi:hypothetical protein
MDIEKSFGNPWVSTGFSAASMAILDVYPSQFPRGHPRVKYVEKTHGFSIWKLIYIHSVFFLFSHVYVSLPYRLPTITVYVPTGSYISPLAILARLVLRK